ncbi:MAG TPA: hypothetical protein VFY99_07515 [Solirubrobacterales bacterium]
MHRTVTFLWVWLAGFACMAAGAAPAAALPGELDPTFGSGGTVVTDLGAIEVITDVALQPDGKIVVAGSATGRILVARYNPDGSLDPTFSDDGFVVTSFGMGAGGWSVALQPDGKIVVAGSTSTGPGPQNLALLRYNADGSLDASFDGDGMLFTDLGASEVSTGIALGPSGNIVVSARNFSGDPEDLVTVRYGSDGSLDGTYGAGGVATTDLGGDERAESLVVEADGKVVVGGFIVGAGTADLVVARYSAIGAPDPTFDGDGVAIADSGAFDIGFSLAAQNDGYLLGGLVAAGLNETPAIARFTNGGALDPGFAGGGFTLLDLGPEGQAPVNLLTQPDDSVLFTPGTSDFEVGRLTPLGRLDPTFGTGGIASVDFGADAAINALALQPDGQIVGAGFTSAGAEPENIALARLGGGNRPTCRGHDATIEAVPGERTPGTLGDDVIVGTAGRDRINGGKGRDRICALGKADKVNGGGGPDVADGGKGRDTMRGAGGSDLLRGGAANDRLAGGGGRDTLVGGKGNRDRCAAGRGDRVRGC